MKKDNVVRDKSDAFTLRIIRLYQYLCNQKKNTFYRNRFYVAAHPLAPILKKQSADNRKVIVLPN